MPGVWHDTASTDSGRHLTRRPTNRCPPQAERAVRCAADSVSPVQCLCFVRTGVAGPQLSSTVRPPLLSEALFLWSESRCHVFLRCTVCSLRRPPVPRFTWPGSVNSLRRCRSSSLSPLLPAFLRAGSLLTCCPGAFFRRGRAWRRSQLSIQPSLAVGGCAAERARRNVVGRASSGRPTRSRTFRVTRVSWAGGLTNRCS